MDEENLMDEDHEDDVLSLENTQLVLDNSLPLHKKISLVEIFIIARFFMIILFFTIYSPWMNVFRSS